MYSFNSVQIELNAANATSSKEDILTIADSIPLVSNNDFGLKLNLNLAAGAFAQAEYFLAKASEILNKEQNANKHNSDSAERKIQHNDGSAVGSFAPPDHRFVDND